MNILFCPVLSNIQNSSVLLESFQASSARLSGNSFNMKMIMEHRWNDTDREKPKYADKNMFQNHFVHHTARAGTGPNPGLRGDLLTEINSRYT